MEGGGLPASNPVNYYTMKIKALSQFSFKGYSFIGGQVYEVGVDVPESVYLECLSEFVVIEDEKPFRKIKTKIIDKVKTK